MTTWTGDTRLRRASRGLRSTVAREAAAAGLAAATAAACGGLLAAGHARMALLGAALPVALLLAVNFRFAMVLLAVTIPFPMSLLGGGAGVSVAGSDVLLALLGAVVVVEGLRGRFPGLGAAVRPTILICAPYLAWLAVLLAAHLGLSDALQTAQRLELFLLAAVVGAAMAVRGHEWTVLKAYVGAVTVIAGLYPFFSNGEGGLGIQKNPAGQFIANGIILLIALKPLRTRWLLPALPVLVLGLFWTMSRGAILSVGIALVVLALTSRGAERGQLAVMGLPLALATVVAFVLLPEDARERNTEFSSTAGTAAAQSVDDRYRYQDEAWQLIHAEPVFGVGIGNYVKGTATTRPSSSDPHNVMFLQAAEGGYPLALAFVVLVIGSVVVVRRIGSHALGPAAAAVVAACVGHGFVDVYWARGTPVLGWLLVGAALAASARDRDDPRDDRRSAARLVSSVGGAR